MLIKRPRRWEAKEAAATPEALFLDRRSALGLTAATLALTACGPGDAEPAGDSSAPLYPFPRNEAFVIDRALTPEEVNARYNNFYEFGSGKDIFKLAQKLPIRPWGIRVDGLVEKEFTTDIDALLKVMPLEERLYRHRCVEAWSMTIPWSGFPMKAFLDYCRPLASAKYVRMETFMDPKVAPGQRATWYPWPYIEGLTIAEASNELAFLVTGTYGHPALKQHGAPLRLAVPWKYGFKSIKSIVRFSFVEERPKTLWATVGPTEYGFWANVNPEVPHPRWSQATERVIGTDETVPTRLFNGYAEEVAHLYKGLEGEKLYM